MMVALERGRSIIKRFISYILALCVVMTCACAAEPTGEYNYYLPLSRYFLNINIDSSWEELALSGDVAFSIEDDDENFGWALFFYTGGDAQTDLFRVEVRTKDTPATGTPNWAIESGEWVAEMYVLSERAGGAYDAVLDAVMSQSDMLEIFDAGALWDFESADIDGNTRAGTSLYGGKLTMLNFWATYCAPCINEMPHLGEIAREYEARGLTIVGVITDVGSIADTGYARQIIEQTGADYLHIITSSGMGMLLSDMQYVPTTIFVDSSGAELARYVGSMDKAAWVEIIEELLAR